MKVNYLWMRMVVAGLALATVVLWGGRALADVQSVTIKVPDNTMMNNSGSVIPDGSGFVQFIKGSPDNPPTGKADSSNEHLSGTDAYGVAQQSPYVGLAIKGPVGYYPNTPAGNGGFYIDNQLNHVKGTKYYIRYWTTDNYYGNSEVEIPWAAGDPVPADMTFTNFTPLYEAAAPKAPLVEAELIGYNLTLDPLVTVKITPPTNTQLASVSGGKFHYEVREGNWTSGTAVITGDTDTTSFQLAPAANLELGKTYYVGAYARNYFGDGPYSVPDEVVITDLALGTPEVEVTYSFVKGTGAFGINTFNVPFDTSMGSVEVVAGPITRVGLDVNETINIGNFVRLINEQAIEQGKGNSIVEVFGYYDATSQKHMGLAAITANSSGAVISSTSIDGMTSTSTILDPYIEGYQVSVNTPITFTLKGYVKQKQP